MQAQVATSEYGLAYLLLLPDKSFHMCCSFVHVYFRQQAMLPVVLPQILCMHGGLSPELKSLEQIKRVARPTDVPDSGLLCDLLWADPDKDIQGWGENDRGVSYTFGPDCVTDFLQKHDLDLVCRAHQVRLVEGEAPALGTSAVSSPVPVLLLSVGASSCCRQQWKHCHSSEYAVHDVRTEKHHSGKPLMWHCIVC